MKHMIHIILMEILIMTMMMDTVMNMDMMMTMMMDMGVGAEGTGIFEMGEGGSEI